MKSNVVTVIALLILLVIQAGCGDATSTKLEISKAFAITSSYSGGLMVYGESATGKKVNVSIGDGLEKTISLEPGVWTFYAIGWDGAAKFTGTPYCGTTTQDTNANKVVEISVASTSCTNDFKTTIGYNFTRFLACSTFNEYIPSEDKWVPITNTTPDTACTEAPIGFLPSYSHYKLVAIDQIQGIPRPVFESACTPIDGSIKRFIPTEKFPFILKAYKSSTDCNDPKSLRFELFHFRDGLVNGYPQQFDSLPTHFSSSPIQTRIILPSLLTKRGKTPFMNMIPNITCGSTATSQGECAPDLVTPVHANVPWTMDTDMQIIQKNASAIAGCAEFAVNSKYFGIKECSLSEGHLKANIFRNPFTCAGPTPIFDTVDMEVVDGKHFILKSNGIEVLGESGKPYANVPSLPGGGLTKIAVVRDGTNYLIYMVNSTTLYRLTYNPFSGAGASTNLPAAGMGDIVAIAPDLLFYGKSDGTLGIRNFDGTYDDFIQPNPGMIINHVDYKNNRAYIVQNGSLSIYNVSGNVINPTPAATQPSGSLTKFAVDKYSNYLYYASSSTLHLLDAMTLSPVTTSGLPVFGPTGFTAVNNKISLANASEFKQAKYNGSMIDPLTDTTGTCSENITVAGKTLTVKTTYGPNYYNLWRDSFEMVGRKSFANLDAATYLFRNFNHDEELSNDGELRKAQEFLGKEISSLLHQYPSCTALDTAVNVSGPKRFSAFIRDQFKSPVEAFEVILDVTDTGTIIPDFMCDPIDPTATSCTEPYDLKLDFKLVMPDGLVVEKGQFLIECNRKLGSYEAYEKKDANKWERKRITYETSNYTQARFESFELSRKDAANISAKLSKLQKDGGDVLRSRQIRTGSEFASTPRFYGSVKEVERSASKLYSKSNHFSSGVSFANLKASNSAQPHFINPTFFGESTTECVSIGLNDIYGTGTTGCTLSGSFTNTQLPNYSAGSLELSVDAMSDLDEALPAIRDYFLLTIP